jgi:hypothetical protein
LKRWLARPSIDPPLELAPVGDGLGVGEGVGEGDGDGLGDGEKDCADAGEICTAINTSEIAAARTADREKLLAIFAIISVRTVCRWDRCRHRQQADRHLRIASLCKVPPPRRRSQRKSRASCWFSES